MKRIARALIAQPGRWPRLLALAACATIVLMFALNTDMGGDPESPRGDGRYRPVLARGDGHMLYLMARSTALDLDWNFDNDLARFGDPWNEPRTPTGHKAIVHPIGPALVWTPLIWTATAGAAIANVFGADIPLHGYTLWVQRFVFLSSALFGCGAVLLGRKLATRVLDGARWATSYAEVAVLLGTSLTYYATFMPSYSHAMDAFACAAFLAYWALTIGRRDRRRWIALGALLGACALVRVQEIAMGIVVACEGIGEAVAALRAKQARAIVPFAVGGAAVLVIAGAMLAPQFLEWHVVFGDATALPQGARYTRMNAPMITELLFASRNGWFSTTPIAYAGVLGLFALPRRHRMIAIGLGAAVAMQVYLNSTVLDWWSSASFGQRRLCNVTLPLVVGLAALIWRCGRIPKLPRAAKHAIAVAILGIFVAYNLNAVGKLTHGRAASPDPEPCCNSVPRPFRGAARWVFDQIGDPFQFPANAIFAVRHGVSLQRYDVAVGNYPVVPAFGEIRDDRFFHAKGLWSIGAPGSEPYLLDGWSAPQQPPGGRRFRELTAARATVLVPNLMPDAQRFALWVSAPSPQHAAIEWNGERVTELDLGPGWTRAVFELAHPALHTNELSVVATPGARVSDLEISLIAPH